MDRHISTTREDNSDKMILRTVEQTQKLLNKHKQVMITNADKGNITVAMYKQDYEEKIKDISRDRTTYRILR